MNADDRVGPKLGEDVLPSEGFEIVDKRAVVEDDETESLIAEIEEADPFTLAAIALGRAWDALNAERPRPRFDHLLAFSQAASAYGAALTQRDQLIIALRAEKRQLEAEIAALAEATS